MKIFEDQIVIRHVIRPLTAHDNQHVSSVLNIFRVMSLPLPAIVALLESKIFAYMVILDDGEP